MKRSYAALTQPGSGLDKLLGELEREVMEIMWARDGAIVRDVLDELNEHRTRQRRLAYTTVMTVMSRLAEKRLLQRQLVGRTHTYRASSSRDVFLARASEDLARQLLDDFGDAAIAGFVSVLEGVAPDRLAKLRRKAQRHDSATPAP